MVGVGIGIGVGLMAVIKALAVGGAIVAVVSVLTWERMKLWFHDRQSLCERDTDNVRFSLIEKLGKNEYKTVYGIFNQRTSTLVETEVINSRSIDETLLGYHDKEPLVVYR
jgi:hypothetical protein